MKKSTLHKLNSALLLGASVAWLASPTPAVADPKTWTGAVDGSWLTGGNWTPSALIAPGDGVIYNASSIANLTQTLNQNWGITNLTVGAVAGPVTISGANGLTNSGPIDMSAATGDLDIAAFYQAGIATGNAATIAAGRTLTLHNTAGNMNNATGPGTIRLVGTKGGQFLDLKGGITLSVDGGSISSGPPVRLTAGAGETVLVEVKNGGAINMPTQGNGLKLNVGNNASVTGTNILRLESGTIWLTNSTGTGANGIFVANENCYGIFDINGGTVDLTNKLTASTAYSAESVLRVPGHAAGQAVVNLNGGVLIVPKVECAVVPVYDSYFYFNGGVMKANRNGTQWMVNLQHALIKAGGAILDTATFDVTIPQPLGEEATSPGGGLTKQGSGILRLTGGNTYTGPTVVAAGTLAVGMATSSYPPGSALVASNATTLNLDITGGMTLQTPSAKLDGTTLNLTYGTLSGNPSQAAISSTSPGGLTLSATRTNVINISGTGFAENGVVPLIDYAGTTIGGDGFAAFKLGTLPIAVSGVLSNDTVNGMIVLHLGQVPAMLTWYGDKSANWDMSTLNWAFGSASYDQTGGVGDIVTFDDTLEGTALNTNVVLTTTLMPTIAQVNNSAYEYVFSGSGKLSGIGTLNKLGTAALTLQTANDFSGGSYLSNGPVRVGHNAGLGTGTVNLLGATLSSDGAAARTVANTVFISAATTLGDSVNSGVLTLAGPVNFNNGARNLTLNSPVTITGGATNGGMFKLGTNTLTFLNCTSTLSSGSSEIRQGTVVLANSLITSGSAFRPACNVPGGEARLVIGTGSVWENSGTAGSFRLGTQGTTGDATATNIVDISGELRVPNAAPPNGKLMYSSNYIGFVNLLPGGVATVTSVAPETGAATAYEEFNFDGGTLRAMTNASSAFMQGLSAAYVRAGGAVVDSDGANITIAQNLLNGGGGGGLTKLGTGTLTLAGTNDYTGPTTVGVGALLVTGDSSAVNGSATVQSGATLGGNGTLGAAVTVALGGTLAPGTGAAPIGTLALTKTLSLHGTTVMELSRDGGSPTNDVVAGLTGVTYGGSLVLTNIGAAPLVLDDTFVLFSAPPGSYGGVFTNVTVPAGYTFDTSKLTADGSVKVTGIPATIPTTPTNITCCLAGDQITLSWPANYKGCFLQGQTNLLSVGLSGNWGNVPNSENVTSVTLTVDPTQGSVFFRLRHP